MANSLRCCLACVLPCGALDLIRIVHLNGYVEEITRPITAGEILNANPNHVLSKPCNSQGMSRKILILSPESELKRGSIYFLIPSSSLPDKKKSNSSQRKSSKKSTRSSNVNSHDVLLDSHEEHIKHLTDDNKSSKKKSSRRDRRTGRSGVWQPHLDSISED